MSLWPLNRASLPSKQRLEAETMNSTNEELTKITTRVSMAALAITRDPSPESIQLLRELNDEMEKAIEGLLNSKK